MFQKSKKNRNRTIKRLGRIPSLRELTVQAIAFWIRAVEDLSVLPFKPFGAWLLEEVVNPTHYPSLWSIERSTYLTPDILRRFYDAYGGLGKHVGAASELPSSFSALWLRGIQLTPLRVQCLRSIAAFITHLDVAGVHDVDDGVCASVFAHLVNARTLVLAETRITNLGLAHMARPVGIGRPGLDKLKHLSLRGCTRITDAGVIKSVTKLPELAVVELTRSGVNEDAAGKILERFHGFRRLASSDESESSRVSSAAEADPPLQWFDPPGCDLDDKANIAASPAMWGDRGEKWSGSGLWRMLIESDLDSRAYCRNHVCDANSKFWNSLGTSARFSSVLPCVNHSEPNPPLIYYRELKNLVDKRESTLPPHLEGWRGKKRRKGTSPVRLREQPRMVGCVLAKDALRTYRSCPSSLLSQQSANSAAFPRGQSLFSALHEVEDEKTADCYL